MNHGTTVDTVEPGTADYRMACAMWAITQGWHVLPVGRDKEARLKDWPNRASTDPQRVADWLIGGHEYAIACGPSGLLVVDEDQPGTFASYAATRGQQVPTTMIVATGRGRHFYFRQPPGRSIGNDVHLDALHLDVRGDGGYVVGPGSRHGSGSLYRTVDDSPVAECPEWLADALIDRRATSKLEGAWTAWQAPPEPKYGGPVAEGERHDRARDLAWHLRQQDIPQWIARHAMRDWFAQHVEQPPKARDPYPWSDAEAALVTAYQKPLEPEPAEPEQSLYVDLASLVAGGEIEQPQPTRLLRSDGRALVYPGKVNVLFGDPEAGKTWVAKVLIAECLLAGGSALMIDLDFNTPEAVLLDLRSLGVPDEVLADPSRFRYAVPEDGRHLDAVVRDARGWQPDVAVVDSVGQVMAMLGLSSNSPDDYTAQNARVLRPLASAGIAVVAIDHLPKSRETAKLGAAGTIAKKAVVTGVSLRVRAREQFTPGSGGEASLTVYKDRHGSVRRHCPPAGADKEQSAGLFRLVDGGNHSLRWEIKTATAEEARRDERERTGLAQDVSLLSALDPPPSSVNDVRTRMGWGTARAQAALKARRQDALLVTPTKGSVTSNAAGEPLACDICGTTENVLRFESPHSTNRCRQHCPITYKEEP